MDRDEIAWLEQTAGWCERHNFGLRDSGNGTVEELSVDRPDDIHQVLSWAQWLAEQLLLHLSKRHNLLANNGA